MAKKPGKLIQPKGNFKFKGLDGKDYKLTLKEKLFSEAYLEFKGNGTEAAMEAFDCANYKVAAAVAYEYLRKPHIFAYIDLKMEDYGYSDENVKKQHLFIINQMADLSAKNKALDMYYKLKGQYAPDKKEFSGTLSLKKLLEEADKENN